MTFERFYIMRHEIVLTLAALIILMVDLAVDGETQAVRDPCGHQCFSWSVLLLAFYRFRRDAVWRDVSTPTALTILMKNILNIGS